MTLSRHLSRGAGATAVLTLCLAGALGPAASVATAAPAAHGMRMVSHLSAPISASGAHVARMSAKAAASWPVGSRTATLTHDGASTSTAPAAQQIVSASVAQYRAASAITAKITFADVPTAETAADIVIAFGTISTDSAGDAVCGDAQGPDVPNVGPTTGVTYDGATISLTAGDPVVKNAAWNCAFVETIPSGDDPSDPSTTAYDAVAGALTDHIQKAILGLGNKAVHVTNKKFSKLKVIVANSSATIATAPHVKLTWKTAGLKVKGNHSVGSIAPGATKTVVLMVKLTQKKARLVLTATSQDVSKKLSLKFKPV